MEVGEIKVRRHPIVAAELVAGALVLFAFAAVDAAVNGYPTPYWILGLAVGAALTAVSSELVADDGALVARSIP